MPNLIDPRKIRTDLDTQIRVDWNEDAVKEYAEAMLAGAEFPALLVFYDEPNDRLILADGFHRLAAHMSVRPNDPILVEQRLGDIEDAAWAAIIANKSHGIRRTNADKRNAIKRAFLHRKGANESNIGLAQKVGVDDKTVASVRRELELSSEIPKIETRTVRRGAQVYQQNTARIGFGKTPPPPDATCRQCVCYRDGICTNDDTRKIPWDPACEDFSMLVEDVHRRDIPPPDYDNIVVCGDKTTQAHKDGLHQNRRLKGCLKVYLPSDNPALFAVELRNRWTPDYLTACIAALKHLLSDNGD